jgi:hypothetical protein
MLDERWSPEARELAEALRGLLNTRCTSGVVREAEADELGQSEELSRHLDDFGLWELPAEPELLAVAAFELGRVLAPVPFVEATSVRAVLGVSGVGYAFDGHAMASLPRMAVRSDAGVEIAPTAGARRRASTGEVLVSVGAAVGEQAGSLRDADRIWRLARLLDAARLAGAAHGALELGTAYAKVRHQFGEPIGAFQAVAHQLVDAKVSADGAELVVRKAAWQAGAGGGDGAPDAVLATIARAKSVAAARQVATVVHQVMGGYGFAVEEDCQLFSRRIRGWSMRLGRVGPDLAELGRTLTDPARRASVRHLWHNERGIQLPRWAIEAAEAESMR